MTLEEALEQYTSKRPDATLLDIFKEGFWWGKNERNGFVEDYNERLQTQVKELEFHDQAFRVLVDVLKKQMR